MRDRDKMKLVEKGFFLVWLDPENARLLRAMSPEKKEPFVMEFSTRHNTRLVDGERSAIVRRIKSITRNPRILHANGGHMNQKDQFKVINAGFTIIRIDEHLKSIKAKTADNPNGWKVIEGPFKSKAAMERRKKDLLERSHIIED